MAFQNCEFGKWVADIFLLFFTAFLRSVCLGAIINGGKGYHLANLRAKTDLGTSAATINVRSVWEQAYQRLKEELALDHFGNIAASPV